MSAMRQRRISEVAMTDWDSSSGDGTAKRLKASLISDSWSAVMLFSLASFDRRAGAGFEDDAAGAEGRFRLGGIFA